MQHRAYLPDPSHIDLYITEVLSASPCTEGDDAAASYSCRTTPSSSCEHEPCRTGSSPSADSSTNSFPLFPPIAASVAAAPPSGLQVPVERTRRVGSVENEMMAREHAEELQRQEAAQWAQSIGCDSKSRTMLLKLTPKDRQHVMKTLRHDKQTRKISAALVSQCRKAPSWSTRSTSETAPRETSQAAAPGGEVFCSTISESCMEVDVRVLLAGVERMVRVPRDGHIADVLCLAAEQCRFDGRTVLQGDLAASLGGKRLPTRKAVADLTPSDLIVVSMG